MRRPTIPIEFSRRMLEGHGWLGVLFGAIIYILCFSGTLIVLVDQLNRWEAPAVPVVRSADPDLLARFAQAAHREGARIGADHDLYIHAPTDELPRLSAFASGEKRQRGEWSGDAAGRLVPETETPWVIFIQNLHFNLSVPGAVGRYLVGIFGTLLLASLVSGVLAHRRILKDAFRLRWGGSKRLSNADLHNRIGVWALPFHLIVSLTGSLLGLSGLIIMVLAMVAFRGDQDRAIAALLGPQATEDARPAPLADIRPMMRRIEADAPGAVIRSLRYEHLATAGQQVQITVATPGYLTEGETWTFAGNGTLKAKAGFTDGNVGMRIYGMITPLHYGTYGGVALKVIYVLLGAGLTMIVATGGNIWLARRRDQGRPAPKLEGAWAALLWSQPLLMAVTAAWSLAGMGWLMQLYWGGNLAILFAGVVARRPVVVTRLLQVAGGLTLVALAIAYQIVVAPQDDVARIVNVGFVLAGMGMLRLAWGKPIATPRTWGRAARAVAGG